MCGSRSKKWPALALVGEPQRAGQRQQQQAERRRPCRAGGGWQAPASGARRRRPRRQRGIVAVTVALIGKRHAGHDAKTRRRCAPAAPSIPAAQPPICALRASMIGW